MITVIMKVLLTCISNLKVLVKSFSIEFVKIHFIHTRTQHQSKTLTIIHNGINVSFLYNISYDSSIYHKQNNYQNGQSHDYVLYTRQYSPQFYFRPFLLLSAVECKTGIILKITVLIRKSIYFNSVWLNSRWDKTV